MTLGAGGLEKIVEIDLTAQERAMFDHSVNSVKELVEITKGLMWLATQSADALP